MQATKTYLTELNNMDLALATEVSLRRPFENYIHNFIKENNILNITILHEGKRIGEYGVPDFRVSMFHSIIGYLETKKIDENLDKTLKSDQIRNIANYRKIYFLPITLSSFGLKAIQFNVKHFATRAT